MRGKFITFEGSEGCGKSTQSKLLADYLRKKGFKVVYVREPGGTKISEQIRKILLDTKNEKMSAVCEMLLYMAARAQIVMEIIQPALKAGKIVICDRFLDSTLVYQGFGLGIDIDFIKEVGRFVTSNLKSDLTIFLDLSVREGLFHRRLIRDRIEKRPLAYHQSVRKGYLKLAAREPKRIKVVKVQVKLDKTQSQVRKLIERYVI